VILRLLPLILVLLALGGCAFPQEELLVSSLPESFGEKVIMRGRLKGDLEWSIAADRILWEEEGARLVDISEGTLHLASPIFFQAAGGIWKEGTLELTGAALKTGDVGIRADKVILREHSAEFFGSGKIVLEVAGDA
jgi:hypothetical protein